jgi:tetratricopeptide (TPR) repeat protein
MSSEASPVPPNAQPAASNLSPTDRARLSQCFQRGTQSAATNVDYAIEMFQQCVLGDPGNAIYLQNLLAVLRKKQGGKPRGPGLSGLFNVGAKAGMKKAAAAAQWGEVLKQGLAVLKTNTFDHSCLLAMAEACGNLLQLETQRVYLKAALDAAPSDVEVNRQCARFLADRGEFDQAVACWVRVSNVRNFAEEAQKEIARLQVEKTIVAGHGLTGRGGAAKAGAAAQPASTDRAAELKALIKAKPTEIENYLELADLHDRAGSVDDAEKTLLDALAASGNDLKVREHLEDRQMRWARQRILVAEKRLEAEDSAGNRATLEKLRQQLLKLEIDVYSARTSRYPENPTWKYELAMRLKAAGNFTEAIRQFQDSLQDPRRRGQVSLELGECFQKIKQYQLAMRNYTTAVDLLTDRELDLRKRALYRAGVLAAGLEDVDAAKKHLSTLAGLDFGYRDVAQRLDKLDSIGHNKNP